MEFASAEMLWWSDEEVSYMDVIQMVKLRMAIKNGGYLHNG